MMWESRGRGKSRNMYKGPMDRDNEVGTNWEWSWRGQDRGKQWGKM